MPKSPLKMGMVLRLERHTPVQLKSEYPPPRAALNSLKEYCTDWDRTVNTDKTKIVIFSKGKLRNLPRFTFDNAFIDIVSDYKYLGIIFNFNGLFAKAKKKHLVDQATKAMYAVITKARQLNLPIDLQFHLFDTLVLPILLYGCEVWGYENIRVLDKIHLKFCKIHVLLGVNKSTSTNIVLGELGRFPIY